MVQEGRFLKMLNDKNKKKVILLFAIMLMVFFEPQLFKAESFAGVEKIDFFYKIAKLACFAVVAFMYIKNNRLRISKLLLKIALLQMIMLASTIIYNGDLARFIGPAVTTVTMCMIGELLIDKKIFFPTLEVLNKYFIICFVINILSVVLIDFTSFSNFTKVYFLGIDNRFIFTLLPWMLFEGLVSIHKDNRINKRAVIVFIACEALLLYKFSVGAMIAFALFAISFIPFLALHKYYKTTILSYLAINVALIYSKIQLYFKPALVMLGKDVTFSGRSFIWDGVINNFKNYPLIGRGMQSVEFDKMFFYNSSAPYYLEHCKVVHAHNSLMTLLYRGGILSVLVYLSIIYDSLKQVALNHKSKYAAIIGISIIIILIASIFDTMDFAALYLVVAIAVNIIKLEPSKNMPKKAREGEK